MSGRARNPLSCPTASPYLCEVLSSRPKPSSFAQPRRMARQLRRGPSEAHDAVSLSPHLSPERAARRAPTAKGYQERDVPAPHMRGCCDVRCLAARRHQEARPCEHVDGFRRRRAVAVPDESSKTGQVSQWMPTQVGLPDDPRVTAQGSSRPGGKATTTKEETCLRGEAQVPLWRQRGLAAANPSKWPKARTNRHKPCGSRAHAELHDPCGSPNPPEPDSPESDSPESGSPEPDSPGPGSAGPTRRGSPLGRNARFFGVAHLCGAVGARAGAAAWIVSVSVGAAAAWIVVVSAGLWPL